MSLLSQWTMEDSNSSHRILISAFVSSLLIILLIYILLTRLRSVYCRAVIAAIVSIVFLVIVSSLLTSSVQLVAALGLLHIVVHVIGVRVVVVRRVRDFDAFSR